MSGDSERQPVQNACLPVASAAFASGEVIHDLVTGRLFYLNRTAAEVWRGLREVSAEEAIAHDLAARYVMDLPAARRDVLALIESLKQAGFSTSRCGQRSVANYSKLTRPARNPPGRPYVS